MRNGRKSGIAARVFLLLAVFLALAGILIYKAHTGEKGGRGTEGYREISRRPEEGVPDGQAQEDTGAAMQEEEETPGRDTPDIEHPAGETGQGTGKTTEAAWQPAAEQEKYAVTVTNADEFAKQVMASRTWLLDKYLSAYVEKKKLRAGEGRILDVAVPDDSIRCTEFYVELDNKKRTLVTLRWDPYACTVTASRCRYTRQEVEGRVWDSRGAVTDISREEDAAVIEAQGEAHAPEGAVQGPGKETMVE